MTSFQEKFSDVVNWLKANATKGEKLTVDAGASFAGKKFLPEVTNKGNNSFGEKTGPTPVITATNLASFGEKTGSTPVTTATNFASSWSPGSLSNNQNLFTFGRFLLTF